MKHAALFAIRFYQRFLSPLKGFACAYRISTGGRSCSHLGQRAIRRFGLVRGTGVLRLRLALCADCHDERRLLSHARRAQLGSCDAPCDLPCEPDVCSCLDCGSCDWGRRKEPRPTRRERQAARQRAREQARQQRRPDRA